MSSAEDKLESSPVFSASQHLFRDQGHIFLALKALGRGMAAAALFGVGAVILIGPGIPFMVASTIGFGAAMRYTWRVDRARVLQMDREAPEILEFYLRQVDPIMTSDPTWSYSEWRDLNDWQKMGSLMVAMNQGRLSFNDLADRQAAFLVDKVDERNKKVASEAPITAAPAPRADQ